MSRRRGVRVVVLEPDERDWADVLARAAQATSEELVAIERAERAVDDVKQRLGRDGEE